MSNGICGRHYHFVQRRKKEGSSVLQTEWKWGVGRQSHSARFNIRYFFVLANGRSTFCHSLCVSLGFGQSKPLQLLEVGNWVWLSCSWPAGEDCYREPAKAECSVPDRWGQSCATWTDHTSSKKVPKEVQSTPCESSLCTLFLGCLPKGCDALMCDHLHSVWVRTRPNGWAHTYPFRVLSLSAHRLHTKFKRPLVGDIFPNSSALLRINRDLDSDVTSFLCGQERDFRDEDSPVVPELTTPGFTISAQVPENSRKYLRGQWLNSRNHAIVLSWKKSIDQ